jgi:hypothetical protein
MTDVTEHEIASRVWIDWNALWVWLSRSVVVGYSGSHPQPLTHHKSTYNFDKMSFLAT